MSEWHRQKEEEEASLSLSKQVMHFTNTSKNMLF